MDIMLGLLQGDAMEEAPPLPKVHEAEVVSLAKEVDRGRRIEPARRKDMTGNLNVAHIITLLVPLPVWQIFLINAEHLTALH